MIKNPDELRCADVAGQRVSVSHEFRTSWYTGIRIDVRPRKCKSESCQHFYEAACQVTRPVREIDIGFRHTPSERAPSFRQRYGRARTGSRPDIVKRVSLARPGDSLFYARSMLKALFGAGA